MTEVPRKNWFQRNWPWLVPVGCGGFLLFVGGFVFVILVFVFGLLKSSEPYQIAVERARASAEVTGALGTPIEEGYFMQGNINISGNSGDADLSIPISGPKGSATVYVTAVKQRGTWTFQRLEVSVHASGERILLPP